MPQPTLPRDFSAPLAPTYQPKDVESGWSAWWEAKGFFSPDAKEAEHAPASRKFILVIPPPNVTGSLHLGHTLTNAIQDSLSRWHRMRGDITLWVPGVDHAGIATQSVVERFIYKNEGITRHDLGREAFLKRVWDWKASNGNHICYQLRRLGVSVDWTREAFTMNPMLSRAVTEAFVRLFDAGLIYRDTRLVLWCPHLKTALSDIEVDTDEITKVERIRIPGYDKTVEVGTLWYFKYVLADDPQQSIVVATTRLETMLGDVAVAVNGEDPRYRDLIGRRLKHPFFPDREVRVIADAHVDMEFGTGAVKITPAHDRNDFEIGQRHRLPMINIFTLDGHINEAGGPFTGLHRFECRVVLEKKLQEMNLLVEKKPNTKTMQLPRCSRSQDIVEYMLVPQWWMNCKDVAAEAVEAVRSGELDIQPDYHKPTWYHWLENIRDWCISRQLWWGHRIPAYKVVLTSPAAESPSSTHETESKDIWVAARDEEEAHAKAKSKLGHSDFTLIQDDDVLDTWFSSALFPFSVFGWPDSTADFNAFFPTTLLETGHDILFFWVARMVMMSLLLIKKLPFRTVLLHAMVRDAHGKKMSKSLGNVIDPIEVIEGITLDEMMKKLETGNLPEKEVLRARDAQKKDFPKGIPECGADALRYGLLAYTSQGRSINLDVNRVVGYRFFCNKLWNATKFALMHFPPDFHARGAEIFSDKATQLEWPEQWILHRLSCCARKTNSAFEQFDFAAAVTATYNFWLYELCDVYLELVKPRLSTLQKSDSPMSPSSNITTANRDTILNVLFIALDRGLRLLHPMLPFVTEELYQRLPFMADGAKSESIAIAAYPLPVPSWDSPLLDDQMDALMSVVRQFRSLLVQLEINPKDGRLHGYLRVTSSETGAPDSAMFLKFFKERATDVAVLAKLAAIHVMASSPDAAFQNAASEQQDEDLASFPQGSVGDVVSDKFQIAVDPKGSVNLSQISVKLQKKLDATQKALDGYVKKIQAPHYLEKVPYDVQCQNEEKIKQLTLERASIEQIQANIRLALSVSAPPHPVQG